jgi:hypothetical protein
VLEAAQVAVEPVLDVMLDVVAIATQACLLGRCTATAAVMPV